MSQKEISVPFEEISNSQTITQVNKRLFAQNDLDIHKNEVDEIVDDHSQRRRIYKIRKVKYFGPWSHRG